MLIFKRTLESRIRERLFKNRAILLFGSRSGDEIDFVEETAGRVRAYECKWNAKEAARFSAFLKLYPHAETTTVSPKMMVSLFSRERF